MFHKDLKSDNSRIESPVYPYEKLITYEQQNSTYTQSSRFNHLHEDLYYDLAFFHVTGLLNVKERF
jgi:hypothetical protein